MNDICAVMDVIRPILAPLMGVFDATPMAESAQPLLSKVTLHENAGVRLRASM